MQYSYVDGRKVLAFPKGKGVCNVCNSDTIAKCGEKIMWHWAHKSKMDCDSWWENETEWHRNWKEQFPEEFREIVHHCEVTGEKHRADIKSDSGIILEIQNSPISLEELRSRESFYKNLLWIINGEKFKSRFKIWKAPLPDPKCSKFDDVVFMASKYESSCSMYWRKSENPEALSTERAMVRVRSTRDIAGQVGKHYIGHHSFHWTRPHIAWLEAKCPVFIDFGTDILWKLEAYRNQFHCVKAVSKEVVISNIKNESSVQNIANGYAVLNSSGKK